MSIQRYTEEPFAAFVENSRGDFVKYADHEAELHHLLSTLADIRETSGFGDKPMLDELAGEIGRIRGDRDAAIADRDGYMGALEKISAERDAAVAAQEAAEGALRWYADVQNYDNSFTAVLLDNGRAAREALAILAGHAPAPKTEEGHE